MSETIGERLSGAGSPERAMRMAWLGKDHSPLVESAMSCLTKLSDCPLADPESLSARRRLCEQLGEITVRLWNSKGSEIEQLANIKKKGPNSLTDWLRALEYTHAANVKIEIYQSRVADEEAPLVRAKEMQRLAPESKRIFAAKIKALESKIDRSVKHGERNNPVTRLEIEKAIGTKREKRSVDYIVKVLRSLGYEIITTGKRGRPRN
ncbi:MAG: hypothetical protein LV479_11225 [Methylacidiphilales bacterium]|nr:hypothetical protein [Candidatus Methylacidiphilales bacterium]